MEGGWTINVGGRLYGPYTSERMRSFAQEGRLSPASLIAREGSTDWHAARDEREFVGLFALKEKEPELLTFAFSPRQAEAAVAAPAEDSRGSDKSDGTRSNFVVIIELKSGAGRRLEETINEFGPNYRLTDNIWIISTHQSVNAIRNRLRQECGKTDTVFVIDASRGKAAWLNFGPEANVRIRRIWQQAS